MPELPDIAVYREALDKHVRGQVLERVRIVNPFVLRTAEPPLITVEGLRVLDVRRLGKRIVLDFGEKIADGPVAEVREDKEVLRAYAGV